MAAGKGHPAKEKKASPDKKEKEKALKKPDADGVTT
jgi:hypothetical protein